MSQNNTIRKSDKKFIRLQKASIRRQFLDVKKQQELINELYKKFAVQPKIQEVKEVNAKKPAIKTEPIEKEAKKTKVKAASK